MVDRSNTASPILGQKDQFTFKETIMSGHSGEIRHSVERVQITQSRFNIQHQDKFTFANRFIERHRTVGYFEVRVLLGGFYDQIAIGVTSNPSFPLAEFAGYQAHSVAYHADDGKCYMEGTSFAYSSRYGSGDVIGCGITADKNIYFSINGILLPLVSC